MTENAFHDKKLLPLVIKLLINIKSQNKELHIAFKIQEAFFQLKNITNFIIFHNVQYTKENGKLHNFPRFKGSSKGYSINDKLSFIPGFVAAEVYAMNHSSTLPYSYKLFLPPQLLHLSITFHNWRH